MMPALRELLLLWLFMSGSLIVMATVVLLAAAVVLGVMWLLCKAFMFTVRKIDSWFDREPPEVKASRDDTVTIYTRVPGPRLRDPGGQRVVRVPPGLVPAAPVVAQRDLERVQGGRRQSRPRGRHG